MASSTSLDEWLHYLEHRHDTPIQMGLERVRGVAEALGLLEWDIPVITVAGTNGKGSTIAHLKAIYQAAGYRVGAYTSPHLIRFNERIQINQQCISDETLTALLTAINQLPASKDLTYFEFTTLAALSYFKAAELDVLLLEVGMGGRLDATNIIDATLAIVTTVAFDHEHFLGDTLEDIAFEKAGIFRSKQKAIYADKNPPRSLLQHAKNLHVDLVQLDGADAVQTAYAAVQMLQNALPVSDGQFKLAKKFLNIDGRIQWLNTEVPTLVDVAHNPQAAARLAAFVRSKMLLGQVHVVFGGLQDKKLSGLIEPMRPIAHQWYLTCLDHKRSATKPMLKKALNEPDEVHIYNTPTEAYQAAVGACKPKDIIIVYGSFILVGEVMKNELFGERIL